MRHMTNTKLIRFSDMLLVFQTGNYDTKINYLNDLVSRIFKNMQ